METHATTSKTTLITGASSGIGAVFARKLAAQGYDLILVARRQARLESLAQEFVSQYSIHTDILVADLATEQGITRVEQHILHAPPLGILINNAGFGTPGAFVEIPIEKTVTMIQVHVLAATRFAWAALQGMRARNQGAIINVSSMAACLPFSPSVNYRSTKIYLNTFSEALQWELRDTNIRVQALCPGYTYSGFHDTAEYKGFDRAIIPNWLWMNAEDVVEYSLQALSRKSVIVIPGASNRALVRLMRTPLTSWLLKKIMQAFVKRKA